MNSNGSLIKSEHIHKTDMPDNVSQALKALGLKGIKISKYDLRQDLKRVYRGLSKQYHPDNENGNAEYYKHITVAHGIVNEWLKPAPPIIQFTYKTDAPTMMALKSLSRKHKVSVAHIVREAVSIFLKGEGK